MLKFSERLKELRTKRGLTQQDMADKMSVNRVTYTNWENEKREPRIDQVVELATILNSTIDYLTGKVDLNVLDIPTDEMKKMSSNDKEIIASELMNNIDTILKAGGEKFNLPDREMKKAFLKVVENFLDEE